MTCTCEKRLGPGGLTHCVKCHKPWNGPDYYCSDCIEEMAQHIVQQVQRSTNMHYRNGRPAANGDKIVKLEGGKVVSFGVLHSATPGNDFCNGNIAIIQSPNDYACLCDCIHIDDLAELIKNAGLDKRPAGK